MTPQEKAKELYNTFESAIFKNGNPNNIKQHIKECAKACCDKLINESTGNKTRMDFYREVKQAIQAL